MAMPELVLGPLLRYVDEVEATLWVETDAPCEVEVRLDGASQRCCTFRVEGHHYALVRISELDPGARTSTIYFSTARSSRRKAPLSRRARSAPWAEERT